MQKSWDQIYDELLVIKCQQGNRAAFNELVSRWQKRLWRYADRVTGSESAAWDIVQETWYGIIKGLRKLDDVSVFPQWAFRIANNKCADWGRRRRQQERLDDELTKQRQNELGEKQNTGEKIESLRAAVEKLSPEHRALLELRYHEGFDIGQIAKILVMPEGTVKSRLNRTLEKLRQIVERYQNE
jgi:RNA polymerase sigma-70 factor (ECF subfamily)